MIDYQDDYDANVWPKDECECGHRRYSHKNGTGMCGAAMEQPYEESVTPCYCIEFSDPEPYFDGM